MDLNFKAQTPSRQPAAPEYTPKDSLEAALNYAERGFGVVPIQPAKSGEKCTCRKGTHCESPGKHPAYLKGLVEHGFNSATTDPETIRAIWSKRPQAGVGIAGCLFIDIDPRHGGTETIKSLQHEHGRLPQTFTNRTGGGGWNKAFVHPDFAISSRASALGPGVDVKSSGGVIAAPTVHPSGRPYRLIDDSEPAELPEAWLDLLRKAQGGPQESAPVEEIPRRADGAVDPAEIGTILEGQRNDRLFAIARRLRDVEAVLEVNRLCCSSPLPESEVRDIARRAMLYPAPAKRQDPAVADAYRRLERRHRETNWTYHGHLNTSVRDFERALLENAREHGWVESGYLYANPSYRWLADAANVAPSSISSRVKPRMEDTGRAYMEPPEDSRKSATWRIPVPEIESVNTSAEVSPAGHNGTPPEVFTDCALPVPRPLRELQTGTFLHGDLVGKTRARALLALEGVGWTTVGELAGRLDMGESSLRRSYLDDRRRYDRELGEHVTASGLVSLGLVEVEGEHVRLPEDYAARLARIEDTRYSTEGRRKVREYDATSGRVVTSVKEIGRVASARERRDSARRLYREQSEAWKLKLVRDAEVETVAFDDLPESPARGSNPDDGEMTPRRAMLTERGWECAGCSFGVVSWIQPVTLEEYREDIAAEIEGRRDEKEAA